MKISIVVFYLFMVSPRDDHTIPISHYRPTAQLAFNEKLIYKLFFINFGTFITSTLPVIQIIHTKQ